MIASLCLIAVGLVLGVWLMDCLYQYREEKTLSQLNSDMRDDLSKYKNLAESLLIDVNYWRDRYHILRKEKDNV